MLAVVHVLLGAVAAGHTQRLSTWNVAGVTEACV